MSNRISLYLFLSLKILYLFNNFLLIISLKYYYLLILLLFKSTFSYVSLCVNVSKMEFKVWLISINRNILSNCNISISSFLLIFDVFIFSIL